MLKHKIIYILSQTQNYLFILNLLSLKILAFEKGTDLSLYCLIYTERFFLMKCLIFIILFDYSDFYSH